MALKCRFLLKYVKTHYSKAIMFGTADMTYFLKCPVLQHEAGMFKNPCVCFYSFLAVDG